MIEKKLCQYCENSKREVIGEVGNKAICSFCVLFSDPSIFLQGGKLPPIKVFEDPLLSRSTSLGKTNTK